MCSSQRIYRCKKQNISVVVVRKNMSKLSLAGSVCVAVHRNWRRKECPAGKVTVYVWLWSYSTYRFLSVQISKHRTVYIVYIKVYVCLPTTIQSLSFFQLFLLVLLFHNTMLFNLSCLLILGHQDTDLETDKKITDGGDMSLSSAYFAFSIIYIDLWFSLTCKTRC